MTESAKKSSEIITLEFSEDAYALLSCLCEEISREISHPAEKVMEVTLEVLVEVCETGRR